MVSLSKCFGWDGTTVSGLRDVASRTMELTTPAAIVRVRGRRIRSPHRLVGVDGGARRSVQHGPEVGTRSNRLTGDRV
jgi:hypothetical protein